MKYIFVCAIMVFFKTVLFAQSQMVRLVKESGHNKVTVLIGDKIFTNFLYPDSIEKPVLYPLFTANGIMVTRGFPLESKPGEPTDHPHHLGLWLNFENVNGLDFWNNSYAIPAAKKHLYGWIKMDSLLEIKNDKTGILGYHAKWQNQNKEVLLEEKTRFEFSGNDHRRIIDRVTILTAKEEVLFKDAKDGLLGMRLAQELQMPTKETQKFKDDKGNETTVNAGEGQVANGNYLSSEGKTGDDVWSTRAVWCMVYGKINNDSVSVAIIDHPQNPNYPTYWHARGYGLFAANPLGENIFTNGKLVKNLQLQKGQSVTFKFRIIIDENKQALNKSELDKIAREFAKK